MTLDEEIHVFEHSRLVCENFTEEAVTAAYVEALAALHSEQDREKGCGWCEGFCPCVTGDPYWDYRFCPICGREL